MFLKFSLKTQALYSITYYQKMIKANNVEDQTDLIRDLKHSHLLQNDINNLIMLKAKYRNSPEIINEKASNECNFLSYAVHCTRMAF